MRILPIPVLAPTLVALLALAAGCATEPAGSAPAAPTAPTAPAPFPPPRYEWVLHYYMAYDNDLDVHATAVVESIVRGLGDDGVAVAISADRADADGMTRTLITRESYDVTRVAEESSADPATLAAELEWVARAAPARRYALIFLDHGGAVPEMCRDLRPGRPGGPEWLLVPDVAAVVRRWRARIPGEVELLFLQQCGKGAAENYGALRETARVLMASQTRLGAPNSYYAATLRHLTRNPGIDGRALAAKIVETEAPGMFTDYAAVDAGAAAELGARLDAVLLPLRERKAALLAPPAGALGAACWEYPPAEPLYDGPTLLRAYYAANGLDAAPLDAFLRWVREELLVAHRVSPRHAALAPERGGFSLPRSAVTR